MGVACSFDWRVASWSLLIGLLLLAGTEHQARAGDEPAQTLHEWLTAHEQDTSFDARKVEFERTYPGETYAGTLEQNMRWLRALRSGTSPTVPAKGASTADAQHLVVRQGAWRLTLDPGTAQARLDGPRLGRTGWAPKGERI